MSDPLADIVSSIKSKLDNPEIIYSRATKTLEPYDVFSTGIAAIDDVLGGGIPAGRITELYGPEASGKTTVMLHLIANCQKNGDLVYFVDAEHALDLSYAQRIGIDPTRMIFSTPDYGEEALEVVRVTCESIAEYKERTGKAHRAIIVVDSIPALVPRAEFDKVEKEGLDVGSNQFSRRAAMLSSALPKIVKPLADSKVALVFINQERDNVGVMYGPKKTQPGGAAMKFFSSLRISINRMGQYMVAGKPAGTKSKIRPVKSKLFPIWGREAEFIINENGINKYGMLAEDAIVYEIGKKEGAMFRYENKSWRGLAALEEDLRKDPQLYTSMLAAVLKARQSNPRKLGGDPGKSTAEETTEEQ